MGIDDIYKYYDDILEHVGIPHDGNIPHSGRYEYGSGKNPYQDDEDAYKPVSTIHDLINKIDPNRKLSETELCKKLSEATGQDIATTDLRQIKATDKFRKKSYDVCYAIKLSDKGYSLETIAAKMNLSTKTVKSYIDPVKQKKIRVIRDIADVIKRQVDESGKPVDVGEGVNDLLCCSKEQLEKSVRLLREEGYNYLRYKIPQLSTGNSTPAVFIYRPNKDGETAQSVRLEFNEHIRNNDYTIPTCNIKDSKEGISLRENINKPLSLDPKRLQIRWGEDGGGDKDGLIELRRGVDDLDMNGSNYAQVRILVGKDKYLKGMAVYADDLPDGVDVRFNTGKATGAPDALKKIKIKNYETGNPADMLGSYVQRQNFYIDKNGKEKQGVLNIVNEQGQSWSNYDDNLASQFLSKQKDSVAKKQLDVSFDDKKALFNEYKKLTNPVVKEHYLKEFAEQCEKDAERLKAAAFPRQSWNVILPVNTLKDNEVYAPGYRDGETIALVRYPHGGIFEIPVLKVNNRNKEGINMIGNKSIDAIGINKKTAAQLSGADFDGDTVIAIPNNDGKISSKSMLKGLVGFSDEMGEKYKEYPGMKVLKGQQKQLEMGKVSNLITDMTLLGANDADIACAVRHSMVVIDAEKHHLNWKLSEQENRISSLKKKWQVQLDENGNIKENKHGAATLISRAKSEIRVPKKSGYIMIDEEGRKYTYAHDENGKILTDKKGNRIRKYDLSSGEMKYASKPVTKKYTEENWPPKDIDLNAKNTRGNKIYTVKEEINKNGEKIYKVTHKEYKRDENGNILQEPALEKTTKMRATDDARTLISYYNTKMERIYADYANNLKQLSRDALKETTEMKKYEQSQSAKQTYKEEVESLRKKLTVAGTFKPLERKAQSLANKIYRQMDEESDTGIEKGDEKAAQNNAVNIARKIVTKGMGTTEKLKASKRIEITDKEWDAIQAGACSKQMVIDILNNTDKDALRKRAMPKQTVGMTSSEIARANRLLDMGYTMQEVADHLGISKSKLQNNINGKEN